MVRLFKVDNINYTLFQRVHYNINYVIYTSGHINTIDIDRFIVDKISTGYLLRLLCNYYELFRLINIFICFCTFIYLCSKIKSFEFNTIMLFSYL